LRSIKDVFLSLCRVHGGRTDTNTCIIPQDRVWGFLRDFSRSVAEGLETREVSPGFERLRVESEVYRENSVESTEIEIEPLRGGRVRLGVRLVRKIHDRGMKVFSRSADGAEAEYTVRLENTLLARGSAAIETDWWSLADRASSAVTDLSMKMVSVSAVERDAFSWFKKAVEESDNWTELVFKFK